MAPQKLLPPHVPYKNMRRFMDDLFPSLDTIHLADGENFAAELDAHGPGSCLKPECPEIRCMALRADILARYPNGFKAA